MPEIEYDCDSGLEAKTVKEEPDSMGGISPVDKRVNTLFLKDNHISGWGS